MDNTRNKKMSQKAHTAFQICMSLYFGLTVLLLAKTWWLDIPQGSQLNHSLVQVIPLLLPLLGLLKKQPRSAAWLCFILCFYFIHGVLSTWITPNEIHEWLITLCTVALFIASMMFTRWQAQAIKIPRAINAAAFNEH